MANRRRSRRGRRPRAEVRCPYCGNTAAFLPSSEALYRGRDYGPVYACLPCGAWVGCHPGTRSPLGRLADAELRRAKIDAHAAFDAVWRAYHADRQAEDPAYPRHRARATAYRQLSEVLGIDPRDCPIGHFDLQTCQRVVELCASGSFRLERRDADAASRRPPLTDP